MTKIHEARMKAHYDAESITIFLIGMRVRRFWKLHKWLPAAMAMPRMIKELESRPELGFLGAESAVGRTTIMIQYWRSREELYAYARNRDAEHLPAWRDFNRRIGTNGDVGIWHETYEVPISGVDSMYVNMPMFGLGSVSKLLPAATPGSRHPSHSPVTVESPAG